MVENIQGNFDVELGNKATEVNYESMRLEELQVRVLQITACPY